MADAEYKAKQAETKSKIKQLQTKKRKNPDDFNKADRDSLIKLQKFRTSLSPSKKAQVKKNIGTATDIALTGLTFVPGLGALGLGAKAIMKGIQGTKTVYKVAGKTFKSKDAAVAAAKTIKAKLPPKVTGNLSAQARGRERITRLADQARKTPSVRGAATRGITKTAAQKAALKTSAKRSAAGAGGLAAISALAATAKEKNKVPVIKATSFKEKPKVTHTPKVPAPKIPPPPSYATPVSKDKFKGEPRTIAQAKRMKKDYFINKAGKKLASVTKKELVKSGLNLRDYLNRKKGLTRRKKAGGVVKKQAGGHMSRVGLSPAEMARAGVMSEARRRQYAKKGGTVNRRGGGQIGIGSAYVQDQYDK